MNSPKITLWYLANAGFLLQAGTQKILIDALHSKPAIPFSPTPSELLRSIMAGEGLFQGISCVAFTHLHTDHCDLDLLPEFTVPNTCLILPRDPDRTPKALPSSQHVIWLNGNVGTLWQNSGVTLTAINTVHDRQEKIPPVVHYSFLVEYEGRCVLFLGDADVGLSHLAPWLEGKHVNAVCVNFVELNQPRGREFLREIVSPDKILPCHIPLPEDDINHFQKMVVRSSERYQCELPPLYPCFKSLQNFIIT